MEGKGRLMQWAYGVTAVTERKDTLLPATIASLGKAGFSNPQVFADDSRRPIGAFGNWVIAAWSVYLRDPYADRFLLCQDDIECSSNLREFLEKSRYPDHGYWNLCLWKPNADDRTGWYPAPDPCGLGAQALVFNNEAMQVLLKSHWLVDHPCDRFRGTRAIDGIVKTALGASGYKEFVHSPSPVRHMGAKCSTLQTFGYQETANFMGEDFDLLRCLGGVCDSCGSNLDVTLSNDTYEYEIQGDPAPRLRCDVCRQEGARDA